MSATITATRNFLVQKCAVNADEWKTVLHKSVAGICRGSLRQAVEVLLHRQVPTPRSGWQGAEDGTCQVSLQRQLRGSCSTLSCMPLIRGKTAKAGTVL